MRSSLFVVVATALSCVLLSGASSSLAAHDAQPARRARRPPATQTPRETGPLLVPVDVGVGPIALVPNLPMALDQPVFGGIVDEALIRKYRGRLPPWARRAAGNLREVRVRPGPLIFVPDELVVSPAFGHTGIGGAGFGRFSGP